MGQVAVGGTARGPEDHINMKTPSKTGGFLMRFLHYHSPWYLAAQGTSDLLSSCTYQPDRGSSSRVVKILADKYANCLNKHPGPPSRLLKGRVYLVEKYTY